MGDEQDLYEVLGVSPKATADEVDAAFGRLAARLHPERNPGDERAALTFKQAVAAYEVLRDP